MSVVVVNLKIITDNSQHVAIIGCMYTLYTLSLSVPCSCAVDPTSVDAIAFYSWRNLFDTQRAILTPAPSSVISDIVVYYRGRHWQSVSIACYSTVRNGLEWTMGRRCLRLRKFLHYCSRDFYIYECEV